MTDVERDNLNRYGRKDPPVCPLCGKPVADHVPDPNGSLTIPKLVERGYYDIDGYHPAKATLNRVKCP